MCLLDVCTRAGLSVSASTSCCTASASTPSAIGRIVITSVSAWLRRQAPRLAAVAALALGLALLPLTADAHVRVHADNTTSGSFSALTFRVPTESDTASTVRLQVDLPTDTPFLYVSTKPMPGWTATTTVRPLPKPVESEGTTITKAVRTVTWTADKGTGIKPGEYQEFSISVGPLPAAGTIELPATQSYSDGKVVTWDQPTPANGDEPEYPAPVLVVTAANSDSDGTPTSPTPSAAQNDVSDASASPSDPIARGLGIAGLVLGAAALAAAVLWRRRPAGSGGST
jgi:uncharacterized protein YcnI